MNKNAFLKKYGLINYPNSIEIDSRKVKKGDMFIALKGKFFDGNDFITKAIQNGATTIIGKMADNTFVNNVQFIHMEDTHNLLNEISYDFYSDIINKMTIYGITGTNGKTSTTYFLREILNFMNISSSVIGTIKTLIGNEEFLSENTTPFANELYKIFKKSYDKNIEHIIMEVSSHGLMENRIFGLNFNVAGITNITQDHLDYHKTMDNYINAKAKIVDHLNNAPLIININSNNAKELVRRINYNNIVTIGKNGDFKLVEYELNIDKSYYTFSYNNNLYEVSIAIPGLFSIYNSLMAIAVANAMKIPMSKAIKGVGKLQSIPGRFEIIKGKGIFAIVDYAHTPDALLNILNSVKALPHNRIIIIFGAGGDRDRSKRPLMGEIADNNSDIIIVTSDNPRTENPDSIIKDILKGINRDTGLFVYSDRKKAIREAINLAVENDIIVVAGKGHEDYQIIGNKKIHFSDQELLRTYLNE